MKFEISPLLFMTCSIISWFIAFIWFALNMQHHNKEKEQKEETHFQYFGIRSNRSGRKINDPYDEINNKRN